MKPFVVWCISIDHLYWVSLFNKLYFQTNSEYSIYIFRRIQSNIWQNIGTDNSVNQSIKLWYQRWPCTEQPSWNSSNNIFKALCSLKLRIAKILHLDIKDDYGLNSHLGILQTKSSKPYVLLGKNLMIGISQISQMLKSLMSDTNNGNALNILYNPYFLFSIKLMWAFKVKRRGKLLKLFYSDIKVGHPLNSHLKFYKQHLPPNHMLSWAESWLDGSRWKRLYHSTQIPKMPMHFSAFIKFFKQHLPNFMPSWESE